MISIEGGMEMDCVEMRLWARGGGMKLATAAGGLLDVLAFFDVDAGFLVCAGGDCGCSHSFLQS
jgi:hypothetical protein